MNKYFFTVAVAASLFATSISHAQQWCNTKVSNQYMTSAGDLVLNASIRGDFLQVCNMNATWKGVSPATCAGWYGLIKSAVSRKADMIIFYNESTPCTSIPYYGNAPAPGYVMLLN